MTIVGMLYPGHSAEDDYPYLESALGSGIRFPVVHTSVGVDAHEVEALLDLGNSERLLDGARQVLDFSPDAVMWACTSGSFVFGWEGARQQARNIEETIKIPTASTSMAFAAALAHLGLRRVTVAATYPQDVAQHFVDYLDHANVEVLELKSHDIPTAKEAGQLDHGGVFALARSNNTAGSEAILIPDTALHTARWLNELESALDKPVLTANQVTAWHGLRLAGDNVTSTELGVLFRA
ncbi:maleate cis-trans isomerase [Arthrobacter sp. H5]|uniref:maleate cis-trans isomerase family protein n=1 Tax=Arthrobacter sp. H5 TaxID=1267973 RepID=UPI000480CEEB|nr:maleate cis-trans isomerase [Arthrobacter sp. H5]